MADIETNPADLVSFQDISKLLEDLFKNKKSKKSQEQILFNFINDFKLNNAHIPRKKNWSFFPILRLLLPELERERAAYNLKEYKLGQLLVKVLGLHKESTDGKKLLNFRSVGNTRHGNDFASVAYFVLKTRGSGSGSLNVGDINNLLDKISSAETGSKGPILDEVFSTLFVNVTAEQYKWFLRIVLKELKLGMGTKKILAAFHPDAPEHYENCNDLLKVCEELDVGNARPLDLGVQLFSAVSPMLSERLDVTDIGKLSLEKKYQIETKFDGERFQIHMESGVFEYFSRRGFKYSDTYGKTYDSGLLTPDLKEAFSPGVGSFIIDGEMMGWHKHLQCFGSKAMAFDIKKITDKSKFKPCFCAFDILYFNGKSLVGGPDKGGVPLHERQKLLDELFEDIPGVIYHSKRQNVKKGSDIITALNDANVKGEEGIVLKDIESYYTVNRRNAGWYKIKPEYTEGTMEDLDLVIIGGDYAENKKQGVAKSFVVALLDSTDGDGKHRWVSVGRVSTGLSFEEREALCARLEPHWKQFHKHPAPNCLMWSKDKPDLWVHPDNSYVLQVRASELVRSSDFTTPNVCYTLRFPRVLKIREDKPVKDILTLAQFENLIQSKSPVIKLSTGQVNADDIEIGSSRATSRKRTAKSLEVASHFRGAKPSQPATSKALLGRKLCVLSDDADCSKLELEQIIYSHGGIVVQNMVPDLWCYVAGRRIIRVTNVLINNPSVTVATSAWLRALEESTELCPLPPPLHQWK